LVKHRAAYFTGDGLSTGELRQHQDGEHKNDHETPPCTLLNEELFSFQQFT
jgi:hypothetical protein